MNVASVTVRAIIHGLTAGRHAAASFMVIAAAPIIVSTSATSYGFLTARCISTVRISTVRISAVRIRARLQACRKYSIVNAPSGADLSDGRFNKGS
jgi:hypothetical protein